MDLVYNRLYGKSRGNSASPARVHVPATTATTFSNPRRAESAPEHASTAATSAAGAEEESEKETWKRLLATAVALQSKARGNPHGVRLSVRTTLNVVQAIYAGTPVESARMTTLVRQCLEDYRAVLLLGRDWVHHGAGVRTMGTEEGKGTVDGGELPCRSTWRRMPEGLDEEACVLLLRLMKGETSHTRKDTDGQRDRATAQAQLVAWLTEQEDRRIAAQLAAGDVNGTELDETRPSTYDLSALLLSQQLRYKPLLEDFCILARHVLVPLDVVRHQHRWLFVTEDVSMTLQQRLHHHRVVLSGAKAAVPTSSARSRAGHMSSHDVRRLWVDLWATLGAAWRQREPLLGAYGRLHGSRARQAVVVVPSPDPATPLPPSGGTAWLRKERYERHVKRARQVAAAESTTTAEVSLSWSPSPYPSEEDTCAFGPLTPDRIGISATRDYLIRDPLASVVRSLTVSVQPSGSGGGGGGDDLNINNNNSNSLQTSPRGTGNGRRFSAYPSPHSHGLSRFSAASSPHASRSPSTFFDSLVDIPAARETEERRSPPRLVTAPAALHQAASPLSPFCLARPCESEESLFDPSSDDAAALTVPYLSPELYLDAQKRKQSQVYDELGLRAASEYGAGEAACSPLSLEGAVSVPHCFSDDAWSVAVLVVEASLTSFDALDSHLAGRSRTGSVFVDIARAVMVRSGVSCDAACNFLYATLHHFSRVVANFASQPGSAQSAKDAAPSGSAGAPSPITLAEEWLSHVRAVHGDEFVLSTLAEVCGSGLQWRRAARWSAFLDVHAHGGGTVGVGDMNTPPPTPRSPMSPAGTSATAQLRAGLASTRTTTTTTFAGAAKDAVAVSRATQRMQRALDCLRLPLLSLFPGTVQEEVFPAHMTSTSETVRNSRTHDNNKSALAGTPWWTAPFLSSVVLRLNQWRACVEAKAGLSRSHGGEQGEVAAFTALVRLTRRALLLRCLADMTEHARRQPHDTHTGASSVPSKDEAATVLADVMDKVRIGRVRYWLAGHPFMRHISAVSQLSAVQAAAFTAPRPGSSPRSTQLPPCAGLFIPISTLDLLLREQVGTAATGEGRGLFTTDLLTRREPPAGAVVEAGAAQTQGKSIRTVVPRPSRTLATLDMYLGDNWRASLAEPSSWHAEGGGGGAQAPNHLAGQARRIAAKRAETDSYYSIVAQAYRDKATRHRPVVPVPLARRALEDALAPLDLLVGPQLDYVARLRRNLLSWRALSQSSSSSSASSSASVARQLRLFLMAQHAHGIDNSEGHPHASSHVPIPATLRDTCWAVLLQVPSAARREKVWSALPLHQAAFSDRQIALDVPRCHQYHALLSSREGREKLFRVIKAWTCLPPSTSTPSPGAAGEAAVAVPRVYWQGVDSVCAVLLTVAYTDEPLSLFLLEQLLNRYVPHEEEEGEEGDGGRGGRGARSAVAIPNVATASQSTTRPVPSSLVALPPVRRNSMPDQLAQFEIVLAYVDPLLATHLFEHLECRAGLFAIGWFLTLFAHSRSAGQVYAVWDFVLLYGEDYPHCFVCVCCALLLSHRELLMSQDLSGCLSTLSRLASHAPAPQLLVNAAVLMQTVPASLRFSPKRTTPGAKGHTASATHRLACLPVETLVGRLDASHMATWATALPCEFPFHIDWADAGLFLVDLRANVPTHTDTATGTRYRHVIIGALPVPLAPQLVIESDPSDDLGEEEEEDGVALLDITDADEERRGGARAEAWSDKRQAARRLAAQRQQVVADFNRRVEEAAAEIARQVRSNGAVMATITPRETPATPSSPSPGAATDALISPMARKTMQEPHIVLVGAPAARGQAVLASSPSVATTDWDVAGPLARQLARFGVHKVAVLLGGLDTVARAAPQLIIRVPEEAATASTPSGKDFSRI